jgi:hypothetical protein
MTTTWISESLSQFAARAITRTRVIAVTLVIGFTGVALQPAQAQSSDTWKSVAIIGGATAAGAYVGHKIAGPTGAWIGAGVGATAGYAIDKKRRDNEYRQYGYNDGYYDPNGYYGQSGPYDANAGYYPNNGGYYPNNGGYGNNGGYYGGPNGIYGGPYNGYSQRGTSQYQGASYSQGQQNCSPRSRR